MILRYRPEIDGFRALAVSSVIMFHARIAGFERGFLGVDVFFVISGFLITSIIFREIKCGTFSYLEFAKRRIRRILPALLLVMMACIPFAWVLMLPDALQNFGQSIFATSLIANNILLWKTAGYWDLSSEFKPLLHTWSLGVEEQFYIIYPFVLLLALKLKPSGAFVLLAGAAIASFGWMAYSQHIDPEGAFYLLHARAWQLLVGAIAGLAVQTGNADDRQLLAVAGLGMVLVGLAPLVEFSLIFAMGLVTIGSALFLTYAKSHGMESWIFTRRPVVFIGLVSYSLYLWHQPVLSFLRISMFESPSITDRVVAVFVAFGLAVVTWNFVEKPFRNQLQPKFAFGTIFGSLIATLAIGSALHLSNGFPQRMKGATDEGAAGATIAYNERIRVLLPRALPSDTGEKPTVLVAGNSFARDFANVLLEAGLKDRLNLLYRDDLRVCSDRWTQEERDLLSKVDAVIFAVSSGICLNATIEFFDNAGGQVFFIGPKHFGNNLNPLIAFSPEERAAARLSVPADVRDVNRKLGSLAQGRYIDMYDVLSDDDGETVRVADEAGELLTADHIHFSKAGAIFMAKRLHVLAPNILEFGS